MEELSQGGREASHPIVSLLGFVSLMAFHPAPPFVFGNSQLISTCSIMNSHHNCCWAGGRALVLNTHFLGKHRQGLCAIICPGGRSKSLAGRTDLQPTPSLCSILREMLPEFPPLLQNKQPGLHLPASSHSSPAQPGSLGETIQPGREQSLCPQSRVSNQ